MNFLLKQCLKPLYYYCKNREERHFYQLMNKWGATERFLPVKSIKFSGNIFSVPDVPSFIWQCKEIFVDKIYDFKSISPNPIIYDCGCNIGTSLIFFSRKFPKAKISAFEADPVIADYCRKNLAQNAASHIDVISKAVWIHDQGIYFSSEGADGGAITTKKKNAHHIPSIRLKDKLIKESAVDLLKMDIEGAEFEVLLDIKEELKKVKHLFVEFHSFYGKDQKLNDILKIIQNAGFRYYIETVGIKWKPFLEKPPQGIDLQINLFCYKNK